MIPEQEDGVEVARPTTPVKGPALILTPHEQIAPVGSEVVLISSFLGNDQRLRTNEPVEWSLDGVGHILGIDPGHACDPLLLDFKRAKKHSDKFALTKTSSHEQTITRGTVDPRDDIRILKGQSWISVNATTEGTTYLTAVATNMKDWSRRSDGTAIHWVDVQWVLPVQSIATVGSVRTLTTTVQRQTNKTARTNWIVRYEILGGPAAGFGPDRAQAVDVPTDATGQASIDLTQIDQQAGTNAIAIRIIRPAGSDGSGRPITLGNETFRQTWTSGGTLSINVVCPPNLTLGQEAECELIVTNNGPVATGARISLPVPVGMQYTGRALPPPIPSSITSGGPGMQPTLLWDTATIAPRGTHVVKVALKPTERRRFDINAQVVPRTVYGTYGTPGASLPGTNPLAPPSASPAGGPSAPAPFGYGTTATDNPLNPGGSMGGPTGGPRADAFSETRDVPRQALIRSAISVSPLSPGNISEGMRSAFEISAENVSGRTLHNVILAIYPPYPKTDSSVLVFGPEGQPVIIDRDTRATTLSFPSVTPGQTVSLRVGYSMAFPYTTIKGDVFGDGRQEPLDSPALTTGAH